MMRLCTIAPRHAIDSDEHVYCMCYHSSSGLKKENKKVLLSVHIFVVFLINCADEAQCFRTAKPSDTTCHSDSDYNTTQSTCTDFSKIQRWNTAYYPNSIDLNKAELN